MKKEPFYKSMSYALQGIMTCIQQERNIKIHLAVMVIVIICAIVLKITVTEWLICILLFALVISLEIINTAIEAVVDLCTQDYHPLAKLAKDAGAGAVLISALAAIIIGMMIFIPKILERF